MVTRTEFYVMAGIICAILYVIYDKVHQVCAALLRILGG